VPTELWHYRCKSGETLGNPRAHPPPSVGSSIRKGLVIPGASVTGGLYLLGLAVAGTQPSNGGNPSGYLIIPIIGPWIALQQLGNYDEAACDRENTDSSKICPSKDGARTAYQLLGAGQLVGVGLIVLGIVASRTDIVPDAVAEHQITVAPFYAGANNAGVAVGGSF